jgi:hypothetical protein
MVSFDITTPDRVCIETLGSLELHNTANRAGLLCVRKGYRLITLWEGSPKDEVYIEEVPAISEEYTVHPALEGTELRLFYFDSAWHLSTRKKLDAFQSKWGAPISHGKIFVRALDVQYGINYNNFLNTLNRNYVYTFFLRNYEKNRVVCLAGPYPDLYFTGAFALFEEPDTHRIPLDKFSIRKLPLLCHSDKNSPKEILRKVKLTDPLWAQGVFICTPTRRIKIYNREYTEMARTRGTEECIAQRYISLKFEEDSKKKLIDMYPEHAALFDNIENRLASVIDSLAILYMHEYEDIPATPTQFENNPPELTDRLELLLCAVRRKVLLGSLSNKELRSAIGREIARLRPHDLYKIL